MEEDLLENIPEGKVYTIRTIVASAFFGGILAGCFMIYQNFKTLGEHKKAALTIIAGVLTLAVLIASTIVPALEKIPGFFYTIFFTLAVSVLSKRYQGVAIGKHIANEGKIYSTGRAVTICLISLLVIVVFAAGFYFLQDFLITE